MNSWLDAYDIKARLTPAALCALPAVVLYHYLLQAQLGGLFTDLGHVRLLGYVTIEAAGTYAVMQLNNRLVGKLLQGIIFKNGHMPTTDLLMPTDKTLSAKTKHELVTKFKKDFSKDLPIFLQGISTSSRRQRITELVAYLRKATRKDSLVRNHNIEYGFVRNLCGGSVLAAIVSTVNAFVFSLLTWNKAALILSLFLVLIYAVIAALSKPLIVYYGKNYAMVLVEQYLCLDETTTSSSSVSATQPE